MQQSNTPRAWRRALSLLLALTLMLGLAPGFPGASETASAHWADPYLSQLVEWGFIREDQAGYPDRALTRADFMAIVNRAYGYHETGETPFEDVAEEDWYYDDVGIAYNARYIHGTSPTTASPKEALTRETAATILGRNMMLEESAGELLDFTDARQISSWAKGTIKSSLEHYLVSGYDDGTFRPQRNVSWGEMASMVTALVGTPLQESGEYSLGGVYGNVTITSPDVTLRDTVISGDLYITGGVGLGGIELENVTVLGRIIASGTGQAEGGQDSILLRNVTADELLVDNLQDNYVSLRADGVTEIGKTTVRTSAYIEDNTPDGLGLQYISLEGESYPEGEEPEGWTPIQLDLAGRIGEVVNRTPGSQVRAASGTVAKLTVDEAAVGSTVVIDRGAVVKELNLDTGTIVTGQGDIEHLTVNAPGCEVEMLPDQIDIRPGITAIIAGEEMDSVAAKESSEQPMILAGYPQAQDIVPTGLDAAFMTNKAGTVYWAVSALTDGSVGEEDLIKPPSYGNIAVRNGSVKVAQGNEETISKVTGLTPGGSYYLSAVLVDARGQRSAVKVISFTTPDNTVPAFNSGYPRMSKVSRTESVATVMPNKDCKLYYALLPQGATAPTEDELKTGSVSGALGYGVLDVKKNTESSFQVNDVILDEVTTYVLYLWLADADGINKGKITSLTFTTDDDTPPEFIVRPYAERTTANSASMKFQLSEPGTVYWVAFPSGSIKNYPKPEPGTDDEYAPWNTMYAIMQVVNAMNIGSDGKSGRVNVRADRDGLCTGTFNITGMKPETSYDVYFVAKDNAGPDRNYSVTIDMVTVTPSDGNPPVITQLFTSTVDAKDKTKNPRANTDIWLEISEDVRFEDSGRTFIELGKDAETERAAGGTETRAVNLLASTLYDSIKLYKVDPQTKQGIEVKSIYNTRDFAGGETPADVVIDYTKAKVEYVSGSSHIRITFPNSGLNLENGGQYYFTIKGLIDGSGNLLEPNDELGVDFWNNRGASVQAKHSVEPFIVESANVEFMDVTNITMPVDVNGNGSDVVSESKSVYFRLKPNSTGGMSDIYSYDIVIWNEQIIAYDLYYRVVDANGNPIYSKDADGNASSYPNPYPETPGDDETAIKDYLLPKTKDKQMDKNGWIYLGNSGQVRPSTDATGNVTKRGRSINRHFSDCTQTEDYLPLKNLNENLRYDFVATVTYFNNTDNASSWDGRAYFYVDVAAGQPVNLLKLPKSISYSTWEEFCADGILGGLSPIGYWADAETDKETLVKWCQLTPSGLPSFIDPTPSFSTTSDSVDITLNLTASGTPAIVHYAISEIDSNGEAKLDTVRAVTMADGSPGTNYVPFDSEKFIDPFNGQFDYDLNDTTGSTSKYLLNPDRSLMVVTLKGPQPPQDSGVNPPAVSQMNPWMKGGGPTADSVRDVATGYNLLVYPTRELIAGEAYTGDVVVENGYGHVTPGQDGKSTFNVSGLKAETDYYAYFVVTLEGDDETISHVYVYHFKTEKPMLPRVSLSEERESEDDGQEVKNGNIIMTIDTVTEGRYRIFSEGDVLNAPYLSFLREPFSDYLAYDGEDGSLKTPEVFLKNGNEDMTVFEALQKAYSFREATNGSGIPTEGFYYPNDYAGDSDPTKVENGYWEYDVGYHVFDMYANDDAKLKLYNLIMNTPTKPVEDRGEGVTAESGKNLTNDPGANDTADTTLNCGASLGDGSYVILTYSINPLMKRIPEYNASHPNNTYRIAAFSGMTFDKGKVGAPNPVSVWGQMNKNSGVYSGFIEVIFDRPTFLHSSSGTTSLAGITGNDLFNASPGVVFPSNGTVVPGTPTATSFWLNYNGATSDAVVRFPGKYFTDRPGDGNDLPLRITIEKINGQEYVVVRWGNANDDSTIVKSPVEITEGAGRELLVEGGIDEGTSNPPVVTLNVGETSDEITARFSQTGGLDNITYRWSELSNDNVITLTDTNGNATVKAKKPGIAWITVEGSGKRTDNNRTETLSKDVKVIVKGEITGFTCVSNNGAVWTSPTLTLQHGGTGAAQSGTVTVLANGTDVSNSAKVVVREKTGTASSYVTCAENANNTISITLNPRIPETFTGNVTVKVGLTDQDGVEDLTPGKEGTFTVHLESSPVPPANSTFSGNRAPAKKVPTDLSFSNVSGAKLSGSTLKLTGTAMSSTINASIIPSGATGTITWSSSNPAVASVTGSGSQATIKGLTAGTTLITATVKGTDVTRSITVTVTPTVNITSFTANSTTSTVKAENDGTYTWTRKSGTSCAAILKFSSSDLSMSNATVTVTSSDKTAVSVGNVTKSGTTGQVQLTFGSMNSSGQVTITIQVGTLSKSFKINLKGGDVILKATK